MKQLDTLPTFYLELETVSPLPNKLRVKLIHGPDSDEESQTYWTDSPLQKKFANITELGQALYECIFSSKENPNEIGQRFRKYYDEQCANKVDSQVCIRLLLNFSSIKQNPEPAVSLPWELLYDGQKWLGKDLRISIARRTAVKHTSYQKNDSPLRVLLAYAEPEKVPPFKGEKFFDVFAEALREITWLDLVLLPKANRFTLKEKLQEGFHIFHFLGHGEAQSSSQTGLEAYLHLESPNYPDYSEKVSAHEFAQWFEKVKIQPKLVVLTACQGAITDKFSALGIAQALLNIGIPSVVAMQARLGIEETKWFASTFYEQLASCATIDYALQKGRQALNRPESRSIRGGLEEEVICMLTPPNTSKDQTVKFPAWAIPVLLLNGDSRLGQEPPPQKICWKLEVEGIVFEMIYIPEGNFYIDKYSVTCAAYKKLDPQWSNPHFKENSSEDFDNYPVTRVSIEQARDFARKTGRRLPLVEEWQQAALSGILDKSQRYPWGNQVQQNSCNNRESGRELLGPMSVIEEAEVYKDNTNPSGMCGIIGNVHEFAEDKTPQGKLCGGTYNSFLDNVSITKTLPPGERLSKAVGFRCIADWQAIKVAQREGRLSVPLSRSCSHE
ncbi:hypothetical protein AMR41_21900 [Hapalosiphon sp. MRB220]|nr:hypothetical protein AMR41_21900 [Hapalosiphon sp. MRB220]